MGIFSLNSPIIIGHIHFAELLDTPISSFDIATIATNYIKDWKDLSPHLGLTRVQEIAICRNNEEYNDQKRAALHRWKICEGDKATYRALIAAAEAASNMKLADDVKTMLQSRKK